MWELQRRKKFQKYLFSEITLLLIAVAIFFVGRATWRLYEKSVESDIAANEVRGEAAALGAREAALMAENRRLNTVEGQEEEIREKYSVAKPGEEMYIIVEKKLEAPDGTEEEVKKSFWAKIGSFFGGD